ncbi:PPE domain-containing protein, partial [Mycobacterium talmoniae]|uniref:PPE domain-containing protein n=1 Tax=Mycobacterium talmoniae TaxID=1858794 RepID=UPI00105897F1
AEVHATALRTGDQGASLTQMAATWRTIAAGCRSQRLSLDAAAAHLQAHWEGDSSDKALSRLRGFAKWFDDAATAADAVAGHADNVRNAHAQALANHPTPETVMTLRSNYANASAAAAAGNPAAASQALNYRRQLTETQNNSNTVVRSYALSSTVPAAMPTPPPSPTNPEPQSKTPGGDQPHDGPSRPHDNDQPPPKHTDADNSDGAANPLQPKSAAKLTPPQASDLPPASTPPIDDPAPAPLLDDAPMMPSPMPMITSLGQGMGGAASPISQTPQSMPQMPQMPTSPPTP